MAKLLTYYDLCTITDHKEFLGLSEDSEPGTVINTLGRNIFQSIRLSNQQHIHSGTVLDKLTNKIVYDFKTSKYVAVFATRYLRLWNKNIADINKVKKIKISKAIHDLVTIRGKNTLTIYKDGTCESLENCIETRRQDKHDKPIIREDEQTIHNVALFTAVDDANWLTYFAKTKSGQVEFVYFKLSQESFTPVGPISRSKLTRTEQNASLIGFSVVDGDVQPSLVTIWSDKRIFMLPLQLDDSNSKSEAPGYFVAMLNLFKVDQPLTIAGVSKDCVAIYGANEHQEGASLVLYNTRFSVPQSKQFFKVYFNNARFWVIGQHILLAYGQTLACVSYRVSKEQLSDMIGSQRSQISSSIVDKDCINEENDLEASFVFDHKSPAIANGFEKPPRPTNGPFELTENIDSVFRSLYEHNVVLSLNRGDILLSDTAQSKIGTNVNDQVFEVEEILLLTAEMEKNGASEFEITEKCIPILIKGQLTDELIKCLQKYTNVSEKVLVKCLKYFLNQTDEVEVPNGLNVTLSNTFNVEQIKTHLRNELNFSEVLLLLEHLYVLLSGDEIHTQDNVQYGDSYSADEQLLAWFSAIIDAHYQQFVLSSSPSLLAAIGSWKELIDEHVSCLRNVKDLTSELYNLVGGKAMSKEKQSSKWYSVEMLKLY